MTPRDAFLARLTRQPIHPQDVLSVARTKPLDNHIWSTTPMEAWIIIKASTMHPVLECWRHELDGRAVKPGFLAFPSQRWLQIFNAAVRMAGGVQPDPDTIRRCIH